MGPAGVTFVLRVKYKIGKKFYLGDQLLFDSRLQLVLLRDYPDTVAVKHVTV